MEERDEIQFQAACNMPLKTAEKGAAVQNHFYILRRIQLYL
jgi:hypothetical protein